MRIVPTKKTQVPQAPGQANLTRARAATKRGIERVQSKSPARMHGASGTGERARVRGILEAFSCPVPVDLPMDITRGGELRFPARLLRNNVRIPARTARRWNDRHLVTVRRRRHLHLRVDIGRADHAGSFAE